MTWLQDTQQSLREKMSRAEDFYSHMLLRWAFRNWLKVGLHHSLPLTTVQFTNTTFAELYYLHSSNIIPFSRNLLSAPHSPSITLFHTEFSLTHCSSIISSLILLPADFPPLLYPLPSTATVSDLFYLLCQRLGEKRRKKAILTCFFVLPSTRIISLLRRREQVPSTQSAS